MGFSVAVELLNLRLRHKLGASAQHPERP